MLTWTRLHPLRTVRIGENMARAVLANSPKRRVNRKQILNKTSDDSTLIFLFIYDWGYAIDVMIAVHRVFLAVLLLSGFLFNIRFLVKVNEEKHDGGCVTDDHFAENLGKVAVG